MVIDLNDIIIDDEFQERHRSLTDEERQELMIQIERFGFREPLVVWQHHNILLDGHNRFDIWHLNYNGDEDHAPDVVEYAFADREQALEWIDKNQRARRNLTSNEMAVLRGREYQETKQDEHSRPNNKSASKNAVDTMTTANSKTSESLAAKHGVSEKQIRRDAKFAEAVDTIEKNVGKEAADEIVKSDKPPISRKQVQQIAQLPAEQQADALEHAKQKPKTRKEVTPRPVKRKTKPITGPTISVSQEHYQVLHVTLNKLRDEFENDPFDHGRSLKLIKKAVREFQHLTEVQP